ncbi:6-bladed beta-propeller [Gemmatimonadota bacterium]
MNRHPLYLLSVWVLLSACSKEETGSPGYYFRTFVEDGINISETSGVPKYEGNILEFVKVLEIKEDERPESILFRPTDFLVDSDGYFHVADSGDGRIAVFDAEGRYQRDYGQRGEGPGEFQMPLLQHIENDIIHIFDLRLLRHTRFQTDGVLLDVTSLPPGNQQRPLNFYYLEDGLMGQIIQQSESDGNDRYEWLDVLVHTTAGDTVKHISTERTGNGYQYSSNFNGRQVTRRGRYPFAGSPLAHYSLIHGLVMNDGNRPVIDIYNTDGVHIRSIRVDLPARPVTGEDRAATDDYWERQLVDTDERARESIEEQRRNQKYREFKSPWYGFIMDDLGYFWLLDADQIRLMEIAQAGLDMMLLSPEGEFLGRTKAPPISFLKFSRGRFLTNVRDPETGESTLTVYEVRPTVPGLIYP